MVNELRARLYAFAFITTLRRAAGLSLSTWLRLGLWLLAAGLGLALLWRAAVGVLVLIFFLWLLYRRARRAGYSTFTPLQHEPDLSEVPLLAGHHRLPVRATGEFSAGRQESFVLLRRGECWHIPVDEHAIMVESSPGRFLYQFIQPDFLENVRIGHFLFGADHYPGLEITFLTDWSPKINTDSIAYYVGGETAGTGRFRRTIYLVFEQEADGLSTWKSLVKREP